MTASPRRCSTLTEEPQPLFSPDTDESAATDPAYVVTRDDDLRAELKAWIEELWRRYEPFCGDSHFRSEMRFQFLARTWELRLACTLMEHGARLTRSRPDGPDVLASIAGVEAAFEAVAPARGHGPNAAGPDDDFPEGEIQVHYLDRDKHVLRYTAAVREKRLQYDQFRKRNTIDEKTPYVIAVNAAHNSVAHIESGPPDIARAVLPIGNQKFRVPLDGSHPPRAHHPFRPVLAKPNGGEVRTDGFLSADYAPVSAVLFSAVSIVNERDLGGRSFVLLHNPMASNPLPRGLLRLGREYWLERDPDRLRWQDWRVEDAGQVADAQSLR